MELQSSPLHKRSQQGHATGTSPAMLREGCWSIRSLMSFHLALSALFSMRCWLPVPCWQAPAGAQEGQAALTLTQMVQKVTEAPCTKSASPWAGF